MKRKASITITSNHAGKPLPEFLSIRFPYHQLWEWEEKIRKQQVLINHVPGELSSILNLGDRIEYRFEDITEPPVNTDFSVLYEDDCLMVVNKPGNLPCHPGGRYFNHTLWSLLKSSDKQREFYFVHRIDRETSGIVLIAKTPEAAKSLGQEFSTGAIYKRYMVIVEGCFPEYCILSEGYLCPDPDSPVRKKLKYHLVEESGETESQGKRCCTAFKKIRGNNKVSLVEAIPETGRIHQIRATLLGLGYPVAGDKLYGLDDSIFLRFISDRLGADDWQRLRLKRQALHAAELHIPHPKSGKMLKLIAPLPQDMEQLITADNLFIHQPSL